MASRSRTEGLRGMRGRLCRCGTLCEDEMLCECCRRGGEFVERVVKDTAGNGGCRMTGSALEAVDVE